MTSPSLFNGPPAFARETRWPAVGAAFAGLAIILVGVAAGGAGYVGCMAAYGVPVLDDASAAPRSPEGIACLLAGLGAQQVLFAVLSLFVAGFFATSRWGALALRPASVATCVLAVLLMVSAVAVYTTIVWLLSPADIAGDLKQLLPVIRSDILWPALLAIGIGAPLSEELLFRGFLLPALSRSPLGFAGAAILTSAAWTALHLSYSLFGLIEVFLIGLYFSWLLWRTGSIWVPIVCHAVYNTAVLFALRFLPLPI